MKRKISPVDGSSKAPGYPMFWATRYAIQSLPARERVAYFGHIALRSALSALDLLGLVMITLSISLLSSGTAILANSGYVGQTLQVLGLAHLHNAYAIVLLIAVGFFALKSIVSIQSTRSLSKFIAKHEASKATQIFSNSLECDVSVLDTQSEKDIGFSLLTSTEYAFGKSLMAIAVIAGEAISILFISIFLAASNPSLFIFVFLFFGLVASAMNLSVSKSSRDAGNEIDRHSRAALAVVHDSVKLSRELRLARGQEAFTLKFSRSRSLLADAYARVNIVSVLPRYVLELAMMVALAIFGLGKAWDWISLSPAVLGLFVAGCFRIASSLIPMQGYLGALTQIDEIGLGARNLEIKTSAKLEQKFDRLFGREIPDFILEAKNLRYSYGDNATIFEGVSFAVSKNSFTALVGASGVGKTTFAEVLAGLREPTSGTIYFNDSSVVGAAPSAARIALVPQHPQLLSGTLLDNITLSWNDQDSNLPLVQDILEKVELKDFIDELPMGLDTIVGDGFRSLSGGQKQRLGIARALYQEPSFLILDEPTSSLDIDVERAVTSVLEKLKGKITILVIAHRPETIQAADRIIELQRSGLVEFPRDAVEDEVK